MTQYTFFGQSIEATRVNNDSNGNPRYVIHFLPIKAFLEAKGVAFPQWLAYETTAGYVHGSGWKPYNNSDYGGGFVAQSYNVQIDLEHLESHLMEAAKNQIEIVVKVCKGDIIGFYRGTNECINQGEGHSTYDIGFYKKCKKATDAEKAAFVEWYSKHYLTENDKLVIKGRM